MLNSEIIVQIQSAMAKVGIDCSETLIFDGKIHRFCTKGDKGKPCWYIIHIFANGFVWCAFGCWKRIISETWHNRDRNLSNQEKILIKQKQEQLKMELKERQDKAKENANYIWEHAQQNFAEHPYLTHKQVKSFGLRLYRGMLLIPLRNENHEICSLQFITQEGAKWFKKDALIKGCFFAIGNISTTIYIAEGYATAATIHEATICSVIVAFSAHNLLLVAQIIRKKYPKIEIIICADNDAFEGVKNIVNIGVQQATIAAQAIKAKLTIPQFKNTETKPTDFNDLMVLEGLDEVHKQLVEAKEVETVAIDTSENRPSQASKIIELAKDLELFHDKQSVIYATIDNNGRKETWRLDSPDFQNWLSHYFWKTHHKAVSKNILQDALGILQGKALFDGECKEVYTRAAAINGEIYIDLVNENWEVVKIASDGWSVLSDSPIKFTRFTNMQPLPIPLKFGNIDNIWQYLNIPRKYRKLVLAFMLECFRTNTPFPILVLYGTQGSAKSTTQEIIRMLIDPSICNLRTAPKKREDLLVAAANNWVASFNNISYLSDVQQDDLCSVATGGALSTRALYTTHQEASVNIKRPVIINSIGDLITAQDLIDRCIILELPEIQAKDRKTEEEIMRMFHQERAFIFGALLDVFARTLQELPNVALESKPRMADFAMLGTALEKAMGWEQGSFMNDYINNRNESMAGALEHSPVAIALMRLIEDTYCYDGSYSYLYGLLSTRYKSDMAGWVKSVKGLANQIKRQKPALRAVGIEITFDNQRHKDGYHVHIQRIENNVHQVHQVHQPMIDGAFKGELVGEHIKPSAPQVRQETPCQHWTGEHGELSEH